MIKGEHSRSTNPPEDEEDNFLGSFVTTKAEYSHPLIVMDTVRYCIQKRAVEMNPGYWNWIMDKSGNSRRVWVEDTRQTFINAVISLGDILSTEISKDKEFKRILTSFEMDCQNVFYKYAYDDYTPFKNKENRIKYIKNGDKLIPLVDATVFIPDVRTGLLKEIKGGWNLKINTYWNSLLEIYDNLLPELIKLIGRLGYFKKRPVVG